MYDTLIERPLTQSQRRCMQLSWLSFLWHIPDDKTINLKATRKLWKSLNKQCYVNNVADDPARVNNCQSFNDHTPFLYGALIYFNQFVLTLEILLNLRKLLDEHFAWQSWAECPIRPWSCVLYFRYSENSWLMYQSIIMLCLLKICFSELKS